ncbi:MAG TPA: acetylornithine transaminase [Candidatus Aerophobetes bacterium]|uniref:Acetylornithine aminotransferase n=1 Tax=Aerophobetes bacterium TaxID=2030807 RepID=A0A7V5I026_UNCAE|nr:acetylornithine transaminase [Candidatus Aerophobetes bacterium]
MNSEKLKNLKEKTEKVIENSQKYLMPTYSRIPIVPEKGEGVRVWDKEGKCYIDLVSGIGVMAVGYSHPRICKVIKEQSQKLVHCSNLYHIENQAKLAEKLCQISFADKVFFCNSGAEANEAAIKLARKFGYQKGAFEIVAMENSFHGRTLATLGLTGQEKYRKWFGPFPPGFKFCEFNNVKKLKEMITSKTCAIIMEPIQGEGGIKEASPEFIEAAREICTEKDILLIFDEVQCGLGRTGKWFAYQHFGVEPDIMTLAKPLAAGLPIGACLAKKNIADIFSPGDHASTFGGGPLVTSVALEVLNIMEEEKLVEKAKEMGKYFRKKLLSLKEKFPFIKEVRGKGLMLGMELDIEGKPVMDKAREKGLLINVTKGKVLRFLPPLIIKEAEIDEAVFILEESFKEI